ncbi:MAG: flavodoxin family protein, partial [Candidatus Fimadaptatus sp.]|nr:flavodoxin family protein [Candidatus Fimadaptatus sp.]
GGSAEEVLKDAEGLQTMRTLGRNMAFMIKSIQLGKQQFGLPEKEPTTFTNFHH